MSETTRKHNPEPLFAIEVEPSSADLSENLAVYRRLSPRQKAVIAAELRRKVEAEIAEDTQARLRRQGGLIGIDRPLSRAKSALRILLRSW